MTRRLRPLLTALLGILVTLCTAAALSACTGPPPPSIGDADERLMRNGQDVVVTPDGARAFVAWGGGAVSAMDVATSEQLFVVPLGGSPQALALTPDGSRLLVTTREGELLVVDPGTRTVGARLRAPGAADVAVSRDGTRAVVACDDAGLATLDLRTGVLGPAVPVGDAPDADVVALLPDGTALVSRYDDNRLDAVDPATGALLWSVPIDRARGIAAGPDGAAVHVVSAGYGTVAVVDVAARARVRTVEPTMIVDGIALDPTGRRLAVANTAGRIQILDAASGAVSQEILGDRGPRGLAFTPDGRRLAVAAASSELFAGARIHEIRP